MTVKRSGILVACVIGGACASEAEVPVWCSGDTEWAAIHVAAESPRVLRLEETWRVGGVEGEAVFARPTRASISRRGRVAVPDMMTSAVILVEPDGTWRGSIVREGDGPGEVRWPADVEWLSEDRLAVFDFAKGEVLRISSSRQQQPESWRLDAGLYGQIAASGSLPGGDLMADGSLLLELPWETGSNGEGVAVATLVRLSSDGSVDTLQTQRVPIVNGGPFRNWPVPGAPRPLYSAGATGPVFRAGMDGTYRVIVATSALIDSAVLCRVTSPLAYSAAEEGGLEELGRLADLLRTAPRPEVPAAIGGLLAGEDGRLWVLRTRPDPAAPQGPPEGGEYDVFDQAGALVGTVRVPERVYLVGEGGGQVYGFERGEYDEVTLVAYRLVEEL